MYSVTCVFQEKGFRPGHKESDSGVSMMHLWYIVAWGQVACTAPQYPITAVASHVAAAKIQFIIAPPTNQLAHVVQHLAGP
jgi:hypothetical protein|mmetsp:Transcript_78762/g.132178  ORF Transcript_78762/g.132178 Transcript_78762/m.132178 type:complete len:81 (-) Transcript_78762:77-319(-)